ncbi:hypothetical protein [Weissella confusa]|uniref:hypothetical protein n=1 Tax=Weissella confusa TaxID=1583 RepID=UPI0018F209C4|nr:hypothetical protein [Weissella confusa]MBJ7665683.1 hypothetical protein [Weissella confusa]
MNIESYKKCSSAISLQGREKSVRKSSIRATGQVISPQLMANQQIITESFQEILSGQEAQTHETRFEMQIGDHEVVPLGDYEAELEIKLVAGP